ncbi:MAG TPA: N-acetyltransferase [Gaiellaceae bacterium]|nr:N-acetyltransferase [Gaiellaceae bacterium]
MIREARPDDHDAIVALTDAAFRGEEEAVRVAREASPELSLVWEEDGELLGNVMLSRMEMGEHRPLQLSPLSVAPSHQGRGIGSALTREALRRADEAGEPFVLVLGHPGYYPRFGFRAATPLGFEPPGDYGEAWMVVLLAADDGSKRGQVTFAPPWS